MPGPSPVKAGGASGDRGRVSQKPLCREKKKKKKEKKVAMVKGEARMQSGGCIRGATEQASGLRGGARFTDFGNEYSRERIKEKCQGDEPKKMEKRESPRFQGELRAS